MPPQILAHQICQSRLLNIKFTKNATLPRLFSWILLVQIISLVSAQVENLPKLIPAGTKHQNNKQQPQPAINWSSSTIETLQEKAKCVQS